MAGIGKYSRAIDVSEQIGRLVFLKGFRDHETTFRIYVLPENEKSQADATDSRLLNKNAVEVFGPITGSYDDTGREVHGWIHDGPWKKDIESIIREKIARKDAIYDAEQRERDRKQKERDKQELELLATYRELK